MGAVRSTAHREDNVNPTAPVAQRLTVDAIAPTVDGLRRPAPQPLGTWFSRWACLYGDDSLVPATPRTDVNPARPLPQLPAAA
jgi:hypothetical protein